MIPFKINFLGLSEKNDLRLYIEKRIHKLEIFNSHIIRCEVSVSCPHHHRHADRLFNIQVQIFLPGEDIVVNQNPSQDEAHLDPHVAARDAFDAAERLLLEKTKIIKDKIKSHRSKSLRELF